MALTYAQCDALTTNATFLGRVRTAVRAHATYLIALGVGATQAQKDWAAAVYWSGHRDAQIAADLAPQVSRDPTVTGSTTGDGSDITDAALQAAVDAICENYH